MPGQKMLDEDSQVSYDSEVDKEYLIPRSESRGTSRSSLGYHGDRSPDTVIHYDKDETCRICLNTGIIPIFGSEDLCEDIKHFACIDISTDDGLPQHLCSACREMLETAVSFRSNAQKSDTILRKTSAVECESQSGCESKSESLPYVIEYNNIDDTAIEETNVDDKLSDEEHSDNGGVYLECCDTAYDSDSDSKISQVDLNISFDAATIPDCELDPEELGYLVNDLKNNKRNLRCEICFINFKTLEQIDEHASEHDSTEIKRCEVCQNIIQESLYNIHIQLHRKAYNDRIKKKYPKVKCTVCQKFVCKTYLKQHMMLHGPDELKQQRYETCTICNVPITKKYLLGHMKLKHSIKDIDEPSPTPKQMCPICLLMIKKTHYKEHVSGHALKQKKIICEECGKEFIHASSFKTHTLTHKNEYKFKCQFCPYRAKHVGLLKIHVRTHTKDYPYKCTTCNKSFITKSNLSTHQRKQHGSPVRFVCSKCGQSYAKASSLLVHNKTVHLNIKDFKCDICGRAYGKKDVLISHQKRIHGIQFNSQVGRTPSYIADINEEE